MKGVQKTVDYWINGYKMMAEEVMKTNWREYLYSLAVVSTNILDAICPVILKWTGYEALKSKTKEGEFYYMTIHIQGDIRCNCRYIPVD